MRISDWSSDVCSSDLNRGRPRPTSISMALSMPKGTDPDIVHDAARAFARVELSERFSYALALHTDTDQPHVHITVADRKSVVQGKRMSVRVDLGGRRIIKKKKKNT